MDSRTLAHRNGTQRLRRPNHRPPDWPANQKSDLDVSRWPQSGYCIRRYRLTGRGCSERSAIGPPPSRTSDLRSLAATGRAGIAQMWADAGHARTGRRLDGGRPRLRRADLVTLLRDDDHLVLLGMKRGRSSFCGGLGIKTSLFVIPPHENGKRSLTSIIPLSNDAGLPAMPIATRFTTSSRRRRPWACWDARASPSAKRSCRRFTTCS